MVMTERVQEKMPCMLCGRLDVPGQWDHTMAIHATNEKLRVRDGSPRILRKWKVFEGEWLVSVKNEWIGGTACYFIVEVTASSFKSLQLHTLLRMSWLWTSVQDNACSSGPAEITVRCSLCGEHFCWLHLFRRHVLASWFVGRGKIVWVDRQ